MGYVLSVEEAVKTATAFESADKKTWNMHLHLDGVNNIQKHICTQGRILYTQQSGKGNHGEYGHNHPSERCF